MEIPEILITGARYVRLQKDRTCNAELCINHLMQGKKVYAIVVAIISGEFSKDALVNMSLSWFQ